MSHMTYEELFGAAVTEAQRQGISVADATPPAKRTCDANGRALHYLDWGGAEDRPPLVLLHGAWTTAHVWDFFSLELRQKYHIYALDLPGHGDSEWHPDADYSRARLAAAVRGLIEALALARPILIGHSLGGS